MRMLLFWRRVWDSNPRGREPKRFSRPPRYDHFDNPPCICLSNNAQHLLFNFFGSASLCPVAVPEIFVRACSQNFDRCHSLCLRFICLRQRSATSPLRYVSVTERRCEDSAAMYFAKLLYHTARALSRLVRFFFRFFYFSCSLSYSPVKRTVRAVCFTAGKKTLSRSATLSRRLAVFTQG